MGVAFSTAAAGSGTPTQLPSAHALVSWDWSVSRGVPRHLAARRTAPSCVEDGKEPSAGCASAPVSQGSTRTGRRSRRLGRRRGRLRSVISAMTTRQRISTSPLPPTPGATQPGADASFDPGLAALWGEAIAERLRHCGMSGRGCRPVGPRHRRRDGSLRQARQFRWVPPPATMWPCSKRHEGGMVSQRPGASARSTTCSLPGGVGLSAAARVVHGHLAGRYPQTVSQVSQVVIGPALARPVSGPSPARITASEARSSSSSSATSPRRPASHAAAARSRDAVVGIGEPVDQPCSCQD